MLGHESWPRAACDRSQHGRQASCAPYRHYTRRGEKSAGKKVPRPQTWPPARPVVTYIGGPEMRSLAEQGAGTIGALTLGGRTRAAREKARRPGVAEPIIGRKTARISYTAYL